MSWVPRGASIRLTRATRREAVDEHTDRLDERVPVAARQVRAADAALEEHVAREQAAFCVEGKVRRRVARDEERLQLEAGDLEALVPVEEHVGLVRAQLDAERAVVVVRRGQDAR